MTAVRCTCGFAELADETVTDHLLRVFSPDDLRGKDGQVHEEGNSLACSCGFTAITPDELDEHFLAMFTPKDTIGRDGNKHGPAGPADGV
jgi:hypothetical protein